MGFDRELHFQTYRVEQSNSTPLGVSGGGGGGEGPGGKFEPYVVNGGGGGVLYITSVPFTAEKVLLLVKG